MAKASKTLKFATRLNKVFIIPNNLGMYFIGVWATCFLLSVGYASNLLLFMAILQFALFFWWMITAHADTSQLKIQSIQILPSHATANAQLEIQWNNQEIVANIREINLFNPNQERFPIVLTNPTTIIFDKRGLYQFKKIEIGLSSGFWLFKTWKYVAVDLTTTVYPKPIKPPYELLQNAVIKDEQQEQKKHHTQSIELDLQRDADEKTRANRINWKRFAQRRQLVERFGESGFQQQQTFDLDAVRSEDQLSYLTFEILHFFDRGESWFLKHKEEILGPFNTSGKNKDELHQCLSLLATTSW